MGSLKCYSNFSSLFFLEEISAIILSAFHDEVNFYDIFKAILSIHFEFFFRRVIWVSRTQITVQRSVHKSISVKHENIMALEIG